MTPALRRKYKFSLASGPDLLEAIVMLASWIQGKAGDWLDKYVQGRTETDKDFTIYRGGQALCIVLVVKVLTWERDLSTVCPQLPPGQRVILVDLVQGQFSYQIF